MSRKIPRKTLRIILDSSFLFIPSQFNIDIFEELANTLNQRFEPIILSSIREELEKMVKSKSVKLQRQATLALVFAQRCRQFHFNKGANESNDDIVVRVASEFKWSVGTNDRDLRKRLRRINVPVIYLRQKSRLVVDGLI